MALARALLIAAVMALVASVPVPTWAQETAPADAKSARAAHQAREVYREKVNENVLFIMGGQLGAAYIQITQDIAVVVDDGHNMRVLPVVGGAGVQNVRDIVFLRGIDLAVTNVTTLNLMRKSGELGPNLERQIAYIAPLFPEEAQIIARGGIQSIEELKGKKVGINNKGSATAVFAPLLFKALGIEIEPVYVNQQDAIQRMRAGELDATICICPKPVPAYATVRAEWGFRLLEVPYPAALQADYLPASISHEDYPQIVPQKEKIETVAGSTVLITFNWPKNSQRYNRTAKFVDAFFAKFAELQKPPRHPLWKTVNYAASLQGWTRFSAAQEWLDRQAAAQSQAFDAGFADFVKAKRAQGAVVGDLSDPDEKERLLREFLEWSQKSKRN